MKLDFISDFIATKDVIHTGCHFTWFNNSRNVSSSSSSWSSSPTLIHCLLFESCTFCEPRPKLGIIHIVCVTWFRSCFMYRRVIHAIDASILITVHGIAFKILSHRLFCTLSIFSTSVKVIIQSLVSRIPWFIHRPLLFLTWMKLKPHLQKEKLKSKS